MNPGGEVFESVPQIGLLAAFEEVAMLGLVDSMTDRPPVLVDGSDRAHRGGRTAAGITSACAMSSTGSASSNTSM